MDSKKPKQTYIQVRRTRLEHSFTVKHVNVCKCTLVFFFSHKVQYLQHINLVSADY